MLRILSFISLIFLSINMHAQQLERRIQVNSGFYFYTGTGSTHTSQFNASRNPDDGYTNNPYGKLPGLSLGASINFKKVTKSRILLGTDMGLEILGSRTKINLIGRSADPSIQAKGYTNLYNTVANVHPYVGYRFYFHQMPFDITTGFDIGYIISGNELGRATAEDGEQYRTSRNRYTSKFDFRPRFQIEARINNIGIYGGYAIGLLDYRSGYAGNGHNHVFSRYIRLGMTFSL